MNGNTYVELRCSGKMTTEASNSFFVFLKESRDIFFTKISVVPSEKSYFYCVVFPSHLQLYRN